ncbi:MAG: phosphoribosylglycinamide formyltransferase [Deltaproteobacteria bacterium CG11_big_fil_rev_8_21_14_0_20_47_16]|nr:MAG: phosphoribosylglycinamide formyltransferase [Deltaproteobacteria bacterium CG11_big_fil_rev_8_21_14_0_20_47_16]
MSNPPIVVLASGTGSNLQAIMDAIAAGRLHARIAAVLSDVPDAMALKRARQRNIPTKLLPKLPSETKTDYSARLAETIRPYAPQLICLAGFMRLVAEPLLTEFSKRIINIHPALLPAYPGLNAIERAFSDQQKVTGCTIHYVDAGIDTGPTIAQQTIEIHSDDTLDSLTRRIHQAEHILYPAVIEKLLHLHSVP